MMLVAFSKHIYRLLPGSVGRGPNWQAVTAYIHALRDSLCFLPLWQAAKMTHADKIGEPVCFEENRYIMNVVYDIIMGQVCTEQHCCAVLKTQFNISI